MMDDSTHSQNTPHGPSTPPGTTQPAPAHPSVSISRRGRQVAIFSALSIVGIIGFMFLSERNKQAKLLEIAHAAERGDHVLVIESMLRKEGLPYEFDRSNYLRSEWFSLAHFFVQSRAGQFWFDGSLRLRAVGIERGWYAGEYYDDVPFSSERAK